MCSCFMLCWEEKRGWVEGYPWAYHVRPYKFISYSGEWLFTAGDSLHYLSHSLPFSLWFASFELCCPQKLVRTATSQTGPPLDQERDTEKMEKILRVGEALPRTLSQARGEQAQTPSRAGGIAEQGTPSTDKTPALKHKDKRQRERLSSLKNISKLL